MLGCALETLIIPSVSLTTVTNWFATAASALSRAAILLVILLTVAALLEDELYVPSKDKEACLPARALLNPLT